MDSIKQGLIAMGLYGILVTIISTFVIERLKEKIQKLEQKNSNLRLDNPIEKRQS